MKVKAYKNQTRHAARASKFLALVAAFICPVVGSNPNAVTRGVSAPAENVEYIGSSRTTIRYLDAFGKYIGQQTYQDKVKVGIGAPRRAGRMVENNPIHLFLAPISNRNAPGQIEIRSAATVRGSLLLQCWNLTVRGNNISGTLSDTHEAESTTLNYLNAVKEIVDGRPNLGTFVFPYPIGKNSKLTGTFDRNEIRLRIQGNVSDGTRPFVSDIVAKL